MFDYYTLSDKMEGSMMAIIIQIKNKTKKPSLQRSVSLDEATI
jgi:hypothetical protein